ncbi:MAG: urea ABC transporter substrate-binding protein [Treponema sp.]|nr:urea ABC transporter substrate-binding protein [Treponema sp.]
MKRQTLGLALAAAFFCILNIGCSKNKEDKFVKVGILHSLTGWMSASENSVVNAEKMAIDEINKNGGVLGKQIKMIVADGKSEPTIFGQEARKLYERDKVATIFGCWTSASRKQAREVVEDPSIYGLLWYPLQYEGMEASPNIMYMGAAPNQQVVPCVEYCFENFGKRMYLVGSDYIFPKTTNKIIKAMLKSLNGECVGEDYQPLDSTNFEGIIQKIIQSKPDIVINTINGSSNKAFFTQLRRAGITAKQIPVMSFSVSEEEAAFIGSDLLEGHLVTWNYIQTIASFQNKNFVKRYRERYGKDCFVGDPMEAAYIAVHLWALACEKAGSFETEAVRIAAKGLTFDAPEGMVKIDGDNQHLQKKVRIGRINSEGLIDEIWGSPTPIKPDPYLSSYAWAKGL